MPNEQENKNVSVKKNFDEVAKTYDENRRKFIPCFDDFYGIAVELTTFAANTSSVLDIGAGTGMLSMKVKKILPDAKYCLVDISDKMLEVARQRFEGIEGISYVVGDFTKFEFSRKFDVIVSALAIHHIEHNKKMDFFKRCFNLLNEGGVFINADQFNENTEYCENSITSPIWNKHIRESGISEEEYKAMLERRKIDNEATVEQDLEWLRSAGFSDVNCFYKYFKFGVLFARKQYN